MTRGATQAPLELNVGRLRLEFDPASTRGVWATPIGSESSLEVARTRSMEVRVQAVRDGATRATLVWRNPHAPPVSHEPEDYDFVFDLARKTLWRFLGTAARLVDADGEHVGSRPWRYETEDGPRVDYEACIGRVHLRPTSRTTVTEDDCREELHELVREIERQGRA